MAATTEIELHIHCHNLPGTCFEERSGVRLGIQKGTEVVGDVSADSRRVTFIAPLKVGQHSTTGKPNFLGPYAQGTAEARFVYLCWGERRDGVWDEFRRAKLSLGHLTADRVTQAVQSGRPLEVAVDMTDDKGGPICATIKSDNIEWM